MRHLKVDFERRDRSVVVRLAGDLDMAEAKALEEDLRRVEGEEDPHLIVIDLSGLTFIDSFGIRALLDAEQRAREAGRRLRLVPARDAIQEIFRVTLLSARFEWIDSAEERPDAYGSRAES